MPELLLFRWKVADDMGHTVTFQYIVYEMFFFVPLSVGFCRTQPNYHQFEWNKVRYLAMQLLNVAQFINEKKKEEKTCKIAEIKPKTKD